MTVKKDLHCVLLHAFLRTSPQFSCNVWYFSFLREEMAIELYILYILYRIIPDLMMNSLGIGKQNVSNNK